MVAIGASAGGFDALAGVLTAIPATFGIPILVVQHVSPAHASHLAELLNRRSALPVREARDGDRPLAGHVYVAPPNHHMLIDDGELHLSDDAQVHFSRPSVDVLFSSLARCYASGAIAVVLSGSGTDGTAGARAIRAAGGRVVVQDEASAINFGMPGSVLAAGAADVALPPHQIAAYLDRESHDV